MRKKSLREMYGQSTDSVRTSDGVFVVEDVKWGRNFDGKS